MLYLMTHAHLECSRSWVQEPVWSNQRNEIDICCFSASLRAGWLRIRLMCQSGATCLPVEYSLSAWTNITNPTQRIGLVQSRHHHLIEM